MNLIFVPASIVAECVTEADRAFPNETGGTFLGWWSDAATCTVTEMIGPGPEAEHRPWSFQPDQDWQLREIARRYRASGRRLSYLGDWHTHPGARSGTPSAADKRAIRTIIGAPEARCPCPIMIIWHGHPGSWKPTPWQGGVRKRFWGRQVEMMPVRMTIWQS